MGEQPGLFQDQFRYGRKVVERARKALFAKKFASFGENALGLIAEAEERFLASGAAALSRECGFPWLRSGAPTEALVLRVAIRRRGQGRTLHERGRRVPRVRDLTGEMWPSRGAECSWRI